MPPDRKAAKPAFQAASMVALRGVLQEIEERHASALAANTVVRLPLVEGLSLESHPEKTLCQYTALDHLPPLDWPTTIELGAVSFPVEVAAWSENRVRLYLEPERLDSHGQPPANGILLVEWSRYWEESQTCLRAILDAGPKGHLLEQFLRIAYSKDDEPENVSSSEALLSAVWGSYQARVAWLGKLCVQAVARQENLLVVSPSHRATDELLFRIGPSFWQNGLEMDKCCLRFRRHFALGKPFDLTSLDFDNHFAGLGSPPGQGQKLLQILSTKLLRSWEESDTKLKKVVSLRRSIESMRERMNGLRDVETSSKREEMRLREEFKYLEEEIRYGTSQLLRHSEQIRREEARKKELEQEIASLGGFELLRRRQQEKQDTVLSQVQLGRFPIVACALSALSDPLLGSHSRHTVILEQWTAMPLPWILAASALAGHSFYLLEDPDLHPPATGLPGFPENIPISLTQRYRKKGPNALWLDED